MAVDGHPSPFDFVEVMGSHQRKADRFTSARYNLGEQDLHEPTEKVP